MKRFKKFLLVVLALVSFISASTFVYAQQINGADHNRPYIRTHFWIPAGIAAPNVQSGISIRPNLNIGIVGIRTRVSTNNAGGLMTWSSWSTRGNAGATVNLASGNVLWSPLRGANCNSTITGEFQFVRNTAGVHRWQSAPNASAALSRCR